MYNIIRPREWRNWQTRTFEGRVDFPYGFKSRLPHQHKRRPERGAFCVGACSVGLEPTFAPAQKSRGLPILYGFPFAMRGADSVQRVPSTRSAPRSTCPVSIGYFHTTRECSKRVQLIRRFAPPSPRRGRQQNDSPSPLFTFSFRKDPYYDVWKSCDPGR